MTSYDHELFVADKGMAEIEAKIVAQGDKIRELKAAKAAKDAIQPEVSFWLHVLFSCHHFTNAGGGPTCVESRIQSRHRRRLEASCCSSKSSTCKGAQPSKGDTLWPEVV